MLLSVPHYNFDWQSVYRLAEAVPMPKGTQAALRGPLRQLGEEPQQPRPDQGRLLGRSDLGRDDDWVDGDRV